MKTVVLLSKVFFEGHPKEGQPTNFAKSVKDGCKRHTVRSNYAYWEKKIAALKKQGGTLCWKIAEEKATLAEWNVPLKNGGDNLLQKYDYFSFLRKDFPLKVIFSA